MKRFSFALSAYFALILVMSGLQVNAQIDFALIERTTFDNPSDYIKYQPQLKQCYDYVLSVPITNDGIDHTIASAFIVKWMAGTPDYTFEIGEFASKLMDKKNDEMLMIYMAALCKAAMEDNATNSENPVLEVPAAKYVAEYLKNPANGVKLSKYHQKLIAAYGAGTLATFLAG